MLVHTFYVHSLLFAYFLHILCTCLAHFLHNCLHNVMAETNSRLQQHTGYKFVHDSEVRVRGRVRGRVRARVCVRIRVRIWG